MVTTRSQQAEEISALLQAGANVAVHAGPGMGKTYWSESMVCELDGQVVRASLDLSTFDAGANVFGELCEQISHAISLRSEPSRPFDLHECWRWLADINSKLGIKVILIIDEFDSVERFADAGEFLRHLRQLLSNSVASGCSALILSRRPLAVIEKRVRGISTLSGVCYAKYLRLVQIEDLTSGTWGPLNEFSEEDLHILVRETAGLPKLIEYWNLQGRSSVFDVDFTEVRDDVIEQHVAYLNALDLAIPAVQLVIGPLLDVDPRDARMLRSLSYVASSTEDRGIADLPGFDERLRLESIRLDAWGIFSRAEKALREIVETIMSEKLGIEWAQTLADADKSVARFYADALSRQEDDHKRFGVQASWLAYTYPGELWKIITLRWDDYREVFVRGDKNYWRARIEGIAALRAPMAHNRIELLGDDRKIQVRMWSEEIVRTWEDYSSNHSMATA